MCVNGISKTLGDLSNVLSIGDDYASDDRNGQGNRRVARDLEEALWMNETACSADGAKEEQVVLRARRGDRDAFLDLVTRYERRLLYFIRRFERDPSRALDILQEVWLTAWQTLGSLHSPACFRMWIYRIAHGRVIAAIRAETRLRERERRSFEQSSKDVIDPAAGIDAIDLVQFALGRLSPEHREVLTLRFLEEMSIAEIALVVDCKEGTAKSRLHAAKQELLKHIEGQTHDRRK